MKHDTFLILKLLIKFLKELVVGQGLFSAKSPCLFDFDLDSQKKNWQEPFLKPTHET